MIILIGGMPRSGTTFLFNTVKEYFNRKNKTIAIHNIKTSFHMGKFFKNENPNMNIKDRGLKVEVQKKEELGVKKEEKINSLINKY